MDEPERDSESHDNASANSLISSEVDHSFRISESYFKGQADNKSWTSFHERISVAPDQVLRYSDSPDAKPLWPVSSGRPSRYDISKCIYCGGSRRFEFQVLPQLLYFFHVEDDADNSLDWATIAVYTFESSCEEQLSYNEEFAWVQLDTPSMSHK